MRKQLLYIALALPLLLGSCSKWLDVQPDASIDVNKLFEKEEGFYEAINGIYTIGSDYDLYGGIFGIEMLEAMMQNYSFSAQDYTAYAKTAAFDFTDINCKSRLERIWSKAYSGIVNCNLVLENVDKRKGVLQPGMYGLIKGEALALRAYFHLDMLRFFGPVYSLTPNADAIPYVTTYSNKVTPVSTAAQAIDYVIKDLNDALSLLEASDPILDPEYVGGYLSDKDNNEEKNENLFLQNRRHRMNYYAVCGALARAYLWKGDYANADLNAREALTGPFEWATRANLTAPADGPNRDRIMYPELVFAWYSTKNQKALHDRFNNTSTGYYVNKDYANLTYEMGVASVGPEDVRMDAWFVVPESNTNVYKIIKYLNNYDEIGNKHYLVTPGIRISEMLYILAECAYNQNKEADAWVYLNGVRDERGIRQVLDSSFDFNTELLKEYRKETYCEGQAFLNYKRLNRNIVGEAAFYEAAKGIYNPPLPESEIEYREENQ